MLAVVGSSARFHPEQAVKPIIDSANAPKPIAAFLVPEATEALLRLGQAGVPASARRKPAPTRSRRRSVRREPKPARRDASAGRRRPRARRA